MTTPDSPPRRWRGKSRPEKPPIEVTVSVPYFKETRIPSKHGRGKALAPWRKTLGRVEWQVPGCAVPAFDCFRTAAAHILINRDGPAIQPGPRRYTRSWVRDCVIMGAALAKAGLPAALREFLTWYAQFQREDGFVPCVVDRDGVDWLVEHDSHGQFLWGIREVIREGGDRRFLRTMYPHVRRRGQLSDRTAGPAHDRGIRLRRAQRVFRPAAGIRQPRRLPRPSRAFLLGRFLGRARS